jgi:dethiobiotin synthase
MKRGIFVTGTDTNIGSALIVAAFLKRAKKVSYWKPIQTGTDSDRETVIEFSRLKAEVSPGSCYQYPEPMAPARAAKIHREVIGLSRIRKRWDELPDEYYWIVEGAGGLLVPVAGKQSMADLALSLDLPLLIVAGTRLGTINHFLLTLEAARVRNIKILGVIWMGSEDPELEESLSDWLAEIPWVKRIPLLPSVDSKSVYEHSDLILVEKLDTLS